MTFSGNKAPSFSFFIAFFLMMSNGTLIACAENLHIDTARVHSTDIRRFSGSVAHFLMGSIYDNFGETDKAMSEYKSALADSGNIPEIYIKIGSGYLVREQTGKAEEFFNKAVSIDPKNTKAYTLLAGIKALNKEYGASEALYEKVLKTDSENVNVLASLADLYLVRGKLDKAAEVYEQMLRIRNDDPLLYFYLSVIYSNLNLLGKAEKDLKKAIQVDRGYIDARMFLGMIYEIDGKNAEAIEQYKKVIALAPRNGNADTRTKRLYRRIGGFDRALEQSRIVMKLNISPVAPYLRIFRIYLIENNLKGAEQILFEAIANRVQDAEIYSGLGYVVSREKEYDKAVKYYRIASEKAPGDQRCRFSLATALDDAGRGKEAVNLLEELVAENTDLPDVYNYLGYTYAEKGIYPDKAVSLIKKALEISPEDGAYLDSLGWAYFRKGDINKALKYLGKALKYLPDDPLILEHEGRVYLELGNKKKAIDLWKRALKKAPDNAVLKKELLGLGSFRVKSDDINANTGK